MSSLGSKASARPSITGWLCSRSWKELRRLGERHRTTARPTRPVPATRQSGCGLALATMVTGVGEGAAVSVTELQERLERAEDDLRRVAAQSSSAKRGGCATGTHHAPDSAGASWAHVQTIRKIGKGTGKRVPELLRQARQLLASARVAVPVWIMPLNRVYESFDPRKTKFDVVIIDEASVVS